LTADRSTRLVLNVNCCSSWDLSMARGRDAKRVRNADAKAIDTSRSHGIPSDGSESQARTAQSMVI
jgi:hypothetical protein